MTGILLTAGSIGVILSAGTGIAAALKWFHTFEIDTVKKKKSSHKEGGAHHDRIKNISERINPRG